MIPGQRRIQQSPAQRVVSRNSRRSAAQGNSAPMVIPYDYAATFQLKGIPGNLVQDVINISTEGIFVAVAIGYGFEEERGRSLSIATRAEFQPSPGTFFPADITLSQLPAASLIEGFRFNPRAERLLFEPDQAGDKSRATARREKIYTDAELPLSYGGTILEADKEPEEISFLFSIVDSNSGRELQDEPTHNLASLGKSNGERPFRQLAQPLTFQPRSTIRLQIVEQSEGIQGTLFVVLYGYKVLAMSVCPESVMQALLNVSPSYQNGCYPPPPQSRVIPFDYVATFQLSGSPGHLIEDEVPVNVESGFVATSIGYGLAVEERSVALQWGSLPDLQNPALQQSLENVSPLLHTKAENDKAVLNLGDLPLRLFPTNALSDGIRIKPSFLRLAFDNAGTLAAALPLDLADRMFERLNRPEDVSFRYAISDSGTGRDLQNQPLNNVAGLGIANGDRPFKRLARPMIFLPRSTIRVTVEERDGRGTLYLVFQGYKILGGSNGRS